MITSLENYFLLALALVFVIGAVMQDFKRREVDNIWNFLLIVFALSYRAFFSINNSDPWFFINGIIGLVIFLGLGNLFYYSRLFAGGDAKLLIALGPILPLSYDWVVNTKIFFSFIILFLVLGSLYVLIWSLGLVFVNFKMFYKEFIRQLKINHKILAYSFFCAIILLIVSIFLKEGGFSIIGLVILLFPILYSFAKSVEESSMIAELPVSRVTEGDWLYKDVNVKNHRIKKNWEGLSSEELKFLQKNYKGKIMIKQGIPFTPAFLFALIGLIIISKMYGFF